MTDLVDLITNPQERMTVLFDAFIKKLETSHQEAEQKLDRVLEHFRLKLHRQHLKTVYSYKKILDELWIRVQKDKDLPVLAMFEQILRSEQPELYADVFDRAIPVIKEIEREGGTLDCRIQKAGYGPGGCLYSDRADGHFSFCSEFLDGFDDDVEFKVTRMRKDEKKAKELEEVRDREWREKWLAKQAPKNEVILADCSKIEGSEPAFS
jgi:RNAse (barnase) inhibitor barstar